MALLVEAMLALVTMFGMDSFIGAPVEDPWLLASVGHATIAWLLSVWERKELLACNLGQKLTFQSTTSCDRPKLWTEECLVWIWSMLGYPEVTPEATDVQLTDVVLVTGIYGVFISCIILMFYKVCGSYFLRAVGEKILYTTRGISLATLNMILTAVLLTLQTVATTIPFLFNPRALVEVFNANIQNIHSINDLFYQAWLIIKPSWLLDSQMEIEDPALDLYHDGEEISARAITDFKIKLGYLVPGEDENDEPKPNSDIPHRTIVQSRCMGRFPSKIPLFKKSKHFFNRVSKIPVSTSSEARTDRMDKLYRPTVQEEINAQAITDFKIKLGYLVPGEDENDKPMPNSDSPRRTIAQSRCVGRFPSKIPLFKKTKRFPNQVSKIPVSTHSEARTDHMDTFYRPTVQEEINARAITDLKVKLGYLPNSR